MNEQHIATLEMLMPLVIDEYIKRTKDEPDEAIKKIYSSHMYELLEREETKMWHFSPVTLCEILNREFLGLPLDIPVEG